MFNHRKADETPLSAGRAEAEKSSGASAYPSTSQSTGFQDKDRSAHHSIVDERLTMKGDLESDGDILVKGKVFGNIKCKLLIIDVDASVEGGVVAEEVVIRGTARGTVHANRVKLEKTANVDSEICHKTFSAEEGARIKGALRFNEEPLSGQTNDLEAKAA